MFKKEIYFILIFLWWIFLIQPTFAADDCENKSDPFAKYECRIEKVCKEYDENKKVFNPEKYKEAEKYKETEISDVFLRSSRTEKPIKKAHQDDDEVHLEIIPINEETEPLFKRVFKVFGFSK